ncbi:hypothetical protein BC830DRAFT_1166283 [Chytriomyces sp. MP71]|nr:hypothetical protein BC830DRAFT_1166283 [Chytriomyces sp. MP71]
MEGRQAIHSPSSLVHHHRHYLYNVLRQPNFEPANGSLHQLGGCLKKPRCATGLRARTATSSRTQSRRPSVPSNLTAVPERRRGRHRLARHATPLLVGQQDSSSAPSHPPKSHSPSPHKYADARKRQSSLSGDMVLALRSAWEAGEGLALSF